MDNNTPTVIELEWLPTNHRDDPPTDQEPEGGLLPGLLRLLRRPKQIRILPELPRADLPVLLPAVGNRRHRDAADCVDELQWLHFWCFIRHLRPGGTYCPNFTMMIVVF